jgi:hypothetical protein
VLTPSQALSAEQRRLLSLYGALSAQDRSSLLAFAEFLTTREGVAAGRQEPQALQRSPRPDEESVVAAMRRLSADFAMLDKGAILHEAAGLMAQHTMQGRPATEVIDELEGLFEREYQRYLEAWQD